MAFNEKCPLLPTTNPIGVQYCATEDFRKDRYSKVQHIGISKAQLLSIEADPFWRCVRLFLTISFWLTLTTMFICATIIIIQAPNCSRINGTSSNVNSSYDAFYRHAGMISV